MSLRERIMLILPFKGRNAFGMLSQVFLPMMTAFFPDIFSAGCAPSLFDEMVSGTRVVIFAKYAISRGRRHGNRPDNPIPLFMVAATIKVAEGRCAMVFEEMDGRSGIQVFVIFQRKINNTYSDTQYAQSRLSDRLTSLHRII